MTSKTKISRRQFCATAAGVTAAAIVPRSSLADSNFYKGKTVQLVVPFSPGGIFDIAGRIVARHLTNHIEGNPNVARLFPDYKNDEIAYYKKTQIFPIMHVMGIRDSIVEKYPWVPVELYKAFNEAKRIGMKRMENPRIAPVVWYREAWEEQEELLGKDPWEYGMTDKNIHNLETLVGYSYEQGLMKNKMSLDQLFLNVEQGRKRGTFRV
jgi:hypothetical protein